jgi:beta-lactam-binding protein with PASTA domain
MNPCQKAQALSASGEFSADLYMQYVNGNPIKIEGANVNVINSATAPTTTVPEVIGLTEQQASAAIVTAGLAASTQIDLGSRPDTVTAQKGDADG